MTRLALLGLCVCLVAALGTATAHADKDSAQKHFSRAMEYYQYGRYDSAAVEFEQSYRENPSPRTLYAWAQAERLAGHYQRSIELYQQFIDTKPPESDVEAAEFGIKECQTKLRDEKARRDAGNTSTTNSTTTQVPDKGNSEKTGNRSNNRSNNRSTTTGNSSTTGNATGGTGNSSLSGNTGTRDDGGAPPWYGDRYSGLMMGGGGVLLVGSFILYLNARSVASGAASSAGNEGELDDILGRARLRRNIAVVGSLAGATLAALGVLRYYRVRRESAGVVTVTPAVDGRSAGVELLVRF